VVTVCWRRAIVAQPAPPYAILGMLGEFSGIRREERAKQAAYGAALATCHAAMLALCRHLSTLFHKQQKTANSAKGALACSAAQADAFLSAAAHTDVHRQRRAPFYNLRAQAAARHAIATFALLIAWRHLFLVTERRYRTRFSAHCCDKRITHLPARARGALPISLIWKTAALARWRRKAHGE